MYDRSCLVDIHIYIFFCYYYVLGLVGIVYYIPN